MAQAGRYNRSSVTFSESELISVEADVRDFLSSGAETGWTDLTALAVVSVQLFDKDGSAIEVSDPIHISVPLPSDTRNRMATSVPTWLYQPKTGKGTGTEFLVNVSVNTACSTCNDSDNHFSRTVGQERDRLHQKGRPAVCLEHCGSSDGILVSCLPFIFRYRNAPSCC